MIRDNANIQNGDRNSFTIATVANEFFDVPQNTVHSFNNSMCGVHRNGHLGSIRMDVWGP